MIKDLIALLSPEQVHSDKDSLEQYGRDWISDYTPNPNCIVFPNSQSDVQAVLRYCHENKIAVVPSGGRTGLSGGATACNGELVLSLARLNKTISVNQVDHTITVDAGVITEKVQLAAAAEGLFFPMDFASKGSSTIGGNIATNAGGIKVLKYGSMRDLVLSLDVVLADGTAITCNGNLIKNNTGYDLRSLLVGSEGTLGIVTQATLKLCPPPKDILRVLCGIESSKSVRSLLQKCRSAFRSVSIFELFPRNGLEAVLQQHSIQDPFPDAFPYYVLIELEDCPDNARDAVEEFFCERMEEETLSWVVMSQSQRQLEELLSLRELLPETLAARYTLHKNDISVPIAVLPEFLLELEALLEQSYQEFPCFVFGHIGDGNLHINIAKPAEMPVATFFKTCKKKDELIFTLVARYRGSISAEHGVGLKKKEYLHFSRQAIEVELMRGIKSAFDPQGILNPGKIFDARP